MAGADDPFQSGMHFVRGAGVWYGMVEALVVHGPPIGKYVANTKVYVTVTPQGKCLHLQIQPLRVFWHGLMAQVSSVQFLRAHSPV